MSQYDSDEEAVSAIRQLLEERRRAVGAKDVAAVAAHYTPDVVTFDLAPPLQTRGVDREGIESWFSGYDGEIGYEYKDVRIVTGDDVAFCHYLYRVTGRLTGGKDVDMWVRATLCFVRVDGAWRITHEHDSEPFDMTTFQALLDLKP